MKGMPYQNASRRQERQPVLSPEVREALAKQAARRPDTGPPRALSVTPRLPRAAKRKRRGRAG
jgi:hypothetical protein